MSNAEVERLKAELRALRASNASAWAAYGSELCVGDMLRQERALEDQIKDAGGDELDISDTYPIEK